MFPVLRDGGVRAFPVAQICNLLCRRFVIGRAAEVACALERAGANAECNSAIQQITNLRYVERRTLNTCTRRPKHAPALPDWLGRREGARSRPD
jgi:hypothetical protein